MGVGPGAHVNGAVIEGGCFLATGVSLFPGARIGAGSEVRINAVVHVNSVLAPGTTVPIGWVAVGDPAEHRTEDRLVEIVDLLAVHADQMVVVLGLARDIHGDMSMTFESPGHPALDLRFERAIDRGERETGMTRAKAVM